MGFFASLLRWLGWSSSPAPRDSWEPPPARDVESQSAPRTVPRNEPAIQTPPQIGQPFVRPRLTPTRRDMQRKASRASHAAFVNVVGASPYRFARFGERTGQYLDLSQDGDDNKLRRRGLPVFQTPEQLADWLGIPLKKVVWLVHRFSAGRPETAEKSHYHYRWLKKNSGGWRLIESPKQTLKQVQIKILREILDRVPAHPSAHGFIVQRSVLTNAKPHVGHATLLKLDLSNFYATVGFSRVIAIFRSLGYSREAAIWLGLLTTSTIPGNMAFPGRDPYAFSPYLRRHLPQGSPTSPALANLSAFRLDLRLAGLSRSFGATYTRYADDLAISGPKDLAFGLKLLIPLVQQIIRKERFFANTVKRKILRSHQRQSIAGVVVNVRPNVARADYDRLKATLTNCVRMGPSTQNREQHADFASHLRGRIAHVQQLNRQRGEKLMAIFNRIDWRR